MLYAACVYTATRIQLWNFVPGWLQKVLRSHFKRVFLSVLVALPLMAFGSWLLHFEVTQHDINKQVAPVINWPLITVLAFLSNLLLPWRDRETDSWMALKRWVVVSLAHTLITYTTYTLLVHVAGWRYLFVSIGLTMVLSPASYVLRNIWIFVTSRGVRTTDTV